MTIAFVDGPVITGDGRILEHVTVLPGLLIPMSKSVLTAARTLLVR